MSTQLITAQYGEITVLFQTNAFINATVIAKQFNKQPRDYLKSEQTKSYIESIKRILLIEQNQLVIVKKGSPENGGGTWFHPKLAIDFARWLSSDFAVWCDMQIEKILYTHKAEPTQPQLPEPPTISKAQIGELATRVNLLAAGDGKKKARIWSRFSNHFRLGGYRELPADKYEDALAYLESKKQEYHQGAEILFISSVELQNKIAEAVKQAQGELIEKPFNNLTDSELRNMVETLWSFYQLDDYQRNALTTTALAFSKGKTLIA